MKQLPRCYAVLWVFSLLLLSARLSAQAGLLEKVEKPKVLHSSEVTVSYVSDF